MPEVAPKNNLVRLKLISPEAEVAVMEVERVSLPAFSGEIMILPQRAPLFVQLKAGIVTAYLPDGTQKRYFISRGIAEVRRNLCPVLAWAIPEDEADKEQIARQLQQETKSHLPKQELSVRQEFLKMILEKIG